MFPVIAIWTELSVLESDPSPKKMPRISDSCSVSTVILWKWAVSFKTDVSQSEGRNATPVISFLGPSVLLGLARLRPRVFNEGSVQCPTERRVSEILGIKLSRRISDGFRLVFFFLGDVRSRLWHVPSCCFSEAVPKVVECG